MGIRCTDVKAPKENFRESERSITSPVPLDRRGLIKLIAIWHHPNAGRWHISPIDVDSQNTLGAWPKNRVACRIVENNPIHSVSIIAIKEAVPQSVYAFRDMLARFILQAVTKPPEIRLIRPTRGRPVNAAVRAVGATFLDDRDTTVRWQAQAVDGVVPILGQLKARNQPIALHPLEKRNKKASSVRVARGRASADALDCSWQSQLEVPCSQPLSLQERVITNHCAHRANDLFDDILWWCPRVAARRRCLTSHD